MDSKIYNISDFGAKECDTVQTEQIQKAIDTCFLNGGGEVVIPQGRFITGGLRLRSDVTLHLLEGAVLEGSVNPEDYLTYLADEIEPISEEERNSVASSAMPQSRGRSVQPYSRWNNAIIRAIHAKNIAIIGEKGSVIDGKNCYDALGEENYRGPHGINMWYCENIFLSGYTLKDAGNWAHAIQNSKDIKAVGITVLGGHDGFDVRTCDNVDLENCAFHMGDDAIAGFDNINVSVRNCILNSSCSALRFGGTNVLVENCTTIAPNAYGFRGNLTPEQKKRMADTDENCRHNCLTAFLYYCDYRANIRQTPQNIVIRNCVFENVDSLFRLNFDGTHVWCKNRSLSGITFENCKITNVCKPIHIYGDEKEPLDFTLKNVSVSAKEGFEDIHTIDAVNFKKIELQNVTFEGFNDTEIHAQTEGEILIHTEA
ncbi:MAG: hypothetical protein IKJ55_04565 [Clostridia bacterium]|nr:hypothetical protein [Clostridia bacterium]